MDYIFESMMMKYDEMVVNEYCYGESYYTEAEKQGLLEKIGEFISNLCEKVMNLVKSLVNKIAGKDVFVKVPKEMVDRVKKAESWFDLFKKAVDAIKRGVLKAIKELVELMKKHPLMTTAVVASAGFIFVKAGAYKKMATTLATIGGRIKDAVKYIIGKKDMVDKDIYDASVATLKSSQVALNKAQADLTACKVENAKKDEIISQKDTEIGMQKDRIKKVSNKVSKIVSRDRDILNKEKASSKEIINRKDRSLIDANKRLGNYQTRMNDDAGAYRYRTKVDDEYKSRPKGISKKNDRLWDEFVTSGEFSRAKDYIRRAKDNGKEISGTEYMKKAFDAFKSYNN